MKQPIIGVFDSGVGGLSVVAAVKKSLPQAKIFYADDKGNLPYGTKSAQQLRKLVVPKLNELVAQGCQIIVIACNTVTTTLIEDLRKSILVPLVGMEPMVKPAAELTKSKIIAVCATPTTLASSRYGFLKDNYAKGVRVLEPDCSNWARMIEDSRIDRQQISDQIDAVCNQNADVVVLGCTHYHWIEDLIKRVAAGRATVLQPEKPAIKQLRQVLGQLA